MKRYLYFTLCKREWASRRKTGLSNILITQGFLWKTKATHLSVCFFFFKKGIFIHRNNEDQFQELEKLILPVLLFYPWTLKKNIANASSVIQQKKSNAKGRTDHVEVFSKIIVCVYCWLCWVLTAAGVFLQLQGAGPPSSCTAWASLWGGFSR